MQDVNKIKKIIEALLIVSEYGINAEELKSAITDSDKKDILAAISLLKEEYASENRAFTIDEIAGRYRIVTKPEYLKWINNLYEKEVDRLTGPSLETLSIIAYKQPVTRTEIEAIRGVNVGGIIKTLLDKGVIRVKGRKDVIGRPLLYATSEKFLEVFGLNSLDDLPALRDFTEEELDFGKPQEVVEMTEENQEKEEASQDREKESVKIEVGIESDEPVEQMNSETSNKEEDIEIDPSEKTPDENPEGKEQDIDEEHTSQPEENEAVKIEKDPELVQKEEQINEEKSSPEQEVSEYITEDVATEKFQGENKGGGFDDSEENK